MNKIVSLLLLFFCSILAKAQIDGFEYEYRQPIQVEAGVLIQWTLISGSTCIGTIIERSTDDIHYEVIGSIDGICGSASFNISYDFTDSSPVPNVRNYYRLVFNRIGASESLSIFVVILNSDGVLIVPNPVRDKAVIYFENTRFENLEFGLYDYQGRSVRSMGAHTENSYEFNRDGLPNGVYLFHFRKDDKITASGRIVVLN